MYVLLPTNVLAKVYLFYA